MPSAKSQRVMLGIAGLLGSALFFGLAFRRLDVASVVASLKHARPMPWLAFAVLAYVAGHWVRGQRLRRLVRRDATLHLPTATNVVVVGYASNNVFPARLGELVRAGMLSERTGMPLSQALTVTFIERLLDGVAILVLLLVAVWTEGLRAGWIGSVARVSALVLGSALVALLVAVLFPGAVLIAASRLSSRLAPAARDHALALAANVTRAVETLRRPRDALAIAGYSAVVWLFEALMFAFVLPVFGLRLALAPSVIAMSVTNLGILAPSSPGFIGSFHFFCAQALTELGVAQPTAMGYALVVHLAFFVPVTLWGGGAILWYGIEVGATAALARAARALPSTATVRGVPMHVIGRLEGSPASPLTASAFDLALCEALTSPDGGATDPDALASAAVFLREEMGALPPRLQLLYRAGMATFRLSVRATSGRGFCELDLDRRRAAVHRWAFGRVALLRQLFRPVRSTVLLAYYDFARAPAEASRVARRSLGVSPHV